jgi:hypothetical protein
LKEAEPLIGWSEPKEMIRIGSDGYGESARGASSPKIGDAELEAILPAQSGARSRSLTTKLIWRRGNKLGDVLPASLTQAASKRRIIPNILAKSRRKPLSRSQSIRHDPFRDRHQEGRKP